MKNVFVFVFVVAIFVAMVLSMPSNHDIKMANIRLERVLRTFYLNLAGNFIKFCRKNSTLISGQVLWRKMKSQFHLQALNNDLDNSYYYEIPVSNFVKQIKSWLDSTQNLKLVFFKLIGLLPLDTFWSFWISSPANANKR